MCGKYETLEISFTKSDHINLKDLLNTILYLQFLSIVESLLFLAIHEPKNLCLMAKTICSTCK